MARRSLRILCLAGLATHLAAAAAHASIVVYDNLDPTPTPWLYNNAGWWLGTVGNTYTDVGSTFTPSTSGRLDELWAGLTLTNPSGSSAVTFSLYQDVGGLPVGTPWQTVLTAANGFGQLLHGTSLNGPTLTGGQSYWLFAAVPNDGVSLAGWWGNNQGYTGSTFSQGVYTYNTQNASLRIGIAATPTPGSLALIGLGAATCMHRRRRA
jgi:hypothetical protein